MKQRHSLYLFILFFAILPGCEPNDKTNQDINNVQSGNLNAETEVSQNTNASTDSLNLKQRTGIPFQIIEASQDTLPLLTIMANLEQNMAVVQAGIWRGDYQTISKAANAMVDHSKISSREVQKIRDILGEQGLKGFVTADSIWHSKAMELAQIANEEKMEPIVNRTMELIQRCASCHMKYRTPLRDSPKWLER